MDQAGRDEAVGDKCGNPPRAQGTSQATRRFSQNRPHQYVWGECLAEQKLTIIFVPPLNQ